MEAEYNRITHMFKDHRFFITGGSGFVGKVFIEKILRLCTTIDKVYMLLREKKGKTPQQRLDEIFSNKLFDKLRQLHGKDIFSKVIAVPGDVMYPNLGISPDFEKLLCEEVTICLHTAATIRFDEGLKKTVLTNTRGTKYFLELAAKMKNVQAIIHLSTAYCHLHEKILYEKTYPPPSDPHKIISLMESFDESTIEPMEKKILKNYPNTYSFSKALSEGLVNEQMDKLPIMIVRPSILIPIWKEPYPGWTDNINGPTGLLIAAGKGVLRTMYGDQYNTLDFLPVDIAANAIMLIFFNFIELKHDSRVFHLTSGHEMEIQWKDVIEIGHKVIEKTPLNVGVWYPGGSMTKIYWLHQIRFYLFQLIPAYFLDIFVYLSGNKPFLVRVQARIQKGYSIFEYYSNHMWEFRNDQYQQLYPKMNSVEKKILKLDKEGLNMYDYFEDCLIATRELLLNEKPETLPAARRNMRIMWWLDKATKTLIGYLFFYYFITNSPYILRLLLELSETINRSIQNFKLF